MSTEEKTPRKSTQEESDRTCGFRLPIFSDPKPPLRGRRGRKWLGNCDSFGLVRLGLGAAHGARVWPSGRRAASARTAVFCSTPKSVWAIRGAVSSHQRFRSLILRRAVPRLPSHRPPRGRNREGRSRGDSPLACSRRVAGRDLLQDPVVSLDKPAASEESGLEALHVEVVFFSHGSIASCECALCNAVKSALADARKIGSQTKLVLTFVPGEAGWPYE